MVVMGIEIDGIAFVCLALCAGISLAHAGSLTASPTQLTVEYPGAVTALKVESNGDDATAGQVRVMRWLQEDGEDKLVPTRDVVASPPALRLDPGKELTVRLVRKAKSPIAGEECYRVLLDQLPGASRDGAVVMLVVRHSIPLCFDSPKPLRGNVQWRIERKGDRLALHVSNSGERRAVAKGVKISGAGGASASLGSATVLGGSEMSWPLTGKIKGFTPGSSFTLTAALDGKMVEIKGKVGSR
jgi:fimbrial chaperone protein